MGFIELKRAGGTKILLNASAIVVIEPHDEGALVVSIDWDAVVIETPEQIMELISSR